MKNIHVIYSEFNNSQVKVLAKHGVNVQAQYDSFEIEEDETYWRLKPYLDNWKIQDFIISKFSQDELKNADLLLFKGVWANGYPMPDNNAGYLQQTYDDKDYCNKCGIGLKQKEPFRLKSEPKWGNKKIFMLNWIYDEIFVQKDFYEKNFKPLGIDFFPVLLYKKNSLIENTVQLNLSISNCSLNLNNYEYEVCENCQRHRYKLINKGFLPSFQGNLNALPIFKSIEYFGTGANARKYIFLSQPIYQLFLKEKIKANFAPCLKS